MKHGQNIPKDKRPAMALRALEISLAEKRMSVALAVIEDEFGVSNPCARNLVSYGKFLTEKAAKALDVSPVANPR